MRFDDISEGVAGPQKCWPGHRKIGTQPGTGKNAGQRVNKCKKIGESSALRQAVKEFAPSFGGDDGDDGFSEETLKRLAAQWWKGDEDPRIERTLMAAGWEIGQDEGYDEGGVFVVQSGDVNGKSYISWSAKDLEGVAEGIGDDVADRDVGEYDREGDMAMGQLKTAEDAAAELRSILDSDENLPEWVQSKITKAVDYLDTARDYMKSKEQDVAEASLEEIYNPTSAIAGFLRSAASIASDLLPVGIAAVGTFAATSAVLGPVAAAIAGSTAGSQIFQTLQNQQNKVPGFIQQMIEKYFGSEAEAQEFALVHAKAAFLNQTEFRWRGQQWSVTLKKNEAEAIIEKNDKYWLEQQSNKEQGVAEANYYNPMDQERKEQEYMDWEKKDFKRREHQAEWEREQEVARQRRQAEQGPWYLRIDGKVYRQKGQPKMFDHKKGANNYALTMIKNNPALQGKIMLTKNIQDQ